MQKKEALHVYLFFRQELNLSFVKGQTYKLQNKVDEIKTGVHVSPKQSLWRST